MNALIVVVPILLVMIAYRTGYEFGYKDGKEDEKLSLNHK